MPKATSPSTVRTFSQLEAPAAISIARDAARVVGADGDRHERQAP
jgi:hypothetical protein